MPTMSFLLTTSCRPAEARRDLLGESFLPVGQTVSITAGGGGFRGGAIQIGKVAPKAGNSTKAAAAGPTTVKVTAPTFVAPAPVKITVTPAPKPKPIDLSSKIILTKVRFDLRFDLILTCWPFAVAA
jgi:hypothetical protein